MSVLYGLLRYFEDLHGLRHRLITPRESDLVKASYSSLWLEMGGEKGGSRLVHITAGAEAAHENDDRQTTNGIESLRYYP